MTRKDDIGLLLDLEAIWPTLGDAHLAFIEIMIDDHYSEKSAKELCFECLTDPLYKILKQQRKDDFLKLNIPGRPIKTEDSYK
jgi:hypothetical protein